MKDRRGFTLVELLAVIVIIGILAIIVVPSVTGYISNTREQTYKAHEKTMQEAAKSYTVECLQGTNTCVLPGKNRKIEIYADELVEKEYMEKLQDPTGKKEFCDLEKSYVIVTNKVTTDPDTGKTVTSYDYESCLFCSSYATNSPNCELKQSSVTVADDTPPVCDGAENENTTWTKGARTVTVGCKDPESGCMRDKYSVLFKDSVGVGQIEIRNRSSNPNAKKTMCNVNVYIDNTKPTCEIDLVAGTYTGEQIDDNEVWISGDNIQIAFKSKDDAHSGLLTYGLGTSYKNPDYNKLNSMKINSATGTTTIFGYVKDKAGNEGICSKTIRTGIARPQFDVYYGYQLLPLKERYTVSGMSVSENGKVTTSSTNPTITFTGMNKYPNVKRAVIVTDDTGLENAANYKLTYGSTTISSMIVNNNRIEFDFPKGTYNTYKFALGTINGKTINIKRIELEVATANLSTNKKITANLIQKPTDVIKSTQFSFNNGSTFQDNYFKEFDTSSAATSGNARTKNDIGMTSDSKPYNIGQMDVIAPNISSLTPNTDSPTANDVILTGKAKDATSGIIEYVFTKNESLPYYSSDWQSITLTKDEISKQSTIISNSRIFFYVKDEAGNVSKKDIQIGFIDKEKPVCSPVTEYAKLKCEDKETTESAASGIVGWYYGKSSTATSYTAVGATPTLTVDATANVTTPGTYYLFVKDRANNVSAAVTDVYYTVTYNPNGGTTPTRTSEIRRKTQTATLNSTSTKTGYTFQGWNTSASATTTQSSVTVNGDTTLYAIFKNNAYTVKFAGNGSTSGSMSDATCTYDVDCTLPTNKFSKTGYLFAGWKFNGTTYADGGKVKNLTASGSVTLTAQWTPIKYYIAFNGNGSTSGSMSRIQCTYDTNCKLTNNAFSRTGYTYDNWATSAGGAKVYNNGQNVLNATTQNEGTVTLYARWSANSYTVAFNGNGNSNGSMASITCYYDQNCKLTNNGFGKTGYSFAGWATSSGGGVAYGNGATVKNLATSGTVTLYAKWSQNSYTIAFNGNGNTGGSTGSKTCTYDANCVLTSNGFSKTGYYFAGWATSSGGGVAYGNGATVKNLAASGTVTLYAKWSPNTYTIAFNGNGNTGGSTGSKSCTYDANCVLPGNGFTKSYHTFQGWATSSGGGVAYGNGATVKNLATSGTVTLYAKWKQTSVYCGGGTYLRANQTSCTTCVAGYYCPGGTYNVSGSDQGINGCNNAGTYSGSGQSSCSSCPSPSTNGGGRQTSIQSCTYNASIRNYTATRMVCNVTNNPTYELTDKHIMGYTGEACPPYSSSYYRYYTCDSSRVGSYVYYIEDGSGTSGSQTITASGSSCATALRGHAGCDYVGSNISYCEDYYGRRCCEIISCSRVNSSSSIWSIKFRYTNSGRCGRGYCTQVDHYTGSFSNAGSVTVGGCGSAPACSSPGHAGNYYDTNCTANYYCPSGGTLISGNKCRMG